MAFTNWEKTKAFTIAFAATTVVTVLLVQLYADGKVGPTNCSYLDPVTVDFLAFAAATFLIVEGAYRLHEHKYASLSKQFTRSLRIAFGCSIVTLHILQFLHK